MTLMHNENMVMHLESMSTIHNGVDTFSRYVILEVETGDMLWVAAEGGTALFSDVGMQTSWLGFRIRNPDPPTPPFGQ
jgi:hypothetical protein